MQAWQWTILIGGFELMVTSKLMIFAAPTAKRSATMKVAPARVKRSGLRGGRQERRGTEECRSPQFEREHDLDAPQQK